MKKQVSALLAAGMAASLLVGCGGAASSSAATSTPAESTPASAATETATGESADITLWTYPIGKWGDSESVDALLADFNAKYPDIHVTVEYLDYTNGDDQVNTAIEGGSAPDLVMEGPERLVANWGAKGLMVDLSDLWTDEQKADISASVESACKDSSGAYYEFPLCMTAHCMAINKNVFEAAGAMQYVDAENHTWTTENFLKAVQAVYDSGKTDVGALYCSGQGGDQGTRALVNNLYGGTFTDAAHTKYTADSAENIKALETLKAQDGINFDASINGGEEITLFRNGTLQSSSAGTLPSRRTLTTVLPAPPTAATRSCSWASPPRAASLLCRAASGASASSTTATRTRSLLPRTSSTLWPTLRKLLRPLPPPATSPSRNLCLTSTPMMRS